MCFSGMTNDCMQCGPEAWVAKCPHGQQAGYGNNMYYQGISKSHIKSILRICLCIAASDQAILPGAAEASPQPSLHVGCVPVLATDFTPSEVERQPWLQHLGGSAA